MASASNRNEHGPLVSHCPATTSPSGTGWFQLRHASRPTPSPVL